MSCLTQKYRRSWLYGLGNVRRVGEIEKDLEAACVQLKVDI
jgi:hypothetical protein